MGLIRNIHAQQDILGVAVLMAVMKTKKAITMMEEELKQENYEVNDIVNIASKDD
ncbi:hypothetical protein WN943_011842 [Citrus x changshan-huyou]